jgi:hypothetical protein
VKKAVVIAALLLTIMSSILAGTLANYSVTLDHIASGSVVGKEFIFTEDGTDTFKENLKIAPTEKVVWHFGVKNYDGSLVTETDLHYDLTFDVSAAPGKSAIAPLIITIRDGSGKAVNSVTGTGTIHVTGDFPQAAMGQSAGYDVEIYWPSTNDDIKYAGGGFGTSINVSATATQVPAGGGSQEPAPTTGSGISVLYEAGTPWNGQGQPQYHNIRFTITNNTDHAITNWELAFLYGEDITAIWNARHSYENLATGQNTILYPDQWRSTIAPGESVVFTGQAQGAGDKAVTTVTVNGVPASVQCKYGQGMLW